MEYGEATPEKQILVLLDWQKAFDNISHEALFSAMERMNLPNKYVNRIKEIYKNQTFKVEMEGQTSEYYAQETGIRQGCPLIPLPIFNCHDSFIPRCKRGASLKTQMNRKRNSQQRF